MSDLKTMKQNPPDGVSASPMSDENLYVWGGTVFGPDDTAWEGGIYSMRLTFTDQYPDKPPRVRFTSEMVRSPPPSRCERGLRRLAVRFGQLATPSDPAHCLRQHRAGIQTLPPTS